ncbi:MAG: response regulator transcription factor [Candidatus Wallbacteria bacterium]|nr:response regulator transcription factor [Candidatus Wallbacteria bacterium]
MAIDVIIADDHAIVRAGIKSVIEKKAIDIRVIGEASNGEELLKLARTSPADVYILDISMPLLNGIQAVSEILKINPQSKVIILSMHDSRSFVEKALQAGAKGYILKDNASEEIVPGIREVTSNRFYLSPPISNFIVEGFLNRDSQAGKNSNELTLREREVLQLIAEGFSNKEIASRMRLALNTVNAHRKNIMEKLNIHKQADLIRYAIKEGLVEP